MPMFDALSTSGEGGMSAFRSAPSAGSWDVATAPREETGCFYIGVLEVSCGRDQLESESTDPAGRESTHGTHAVNIGIRPIGHIPDGQSSRGMNCRRIRRDTRRPRAQDTQQRSVISFRRGTNDEERLTALFVIPQARATRAHVGIYLHHLVVIHEKRTADPDTRSSACGTRMRQSVREISCITPAPYCAPNLVTASGPV